MKILRNNFICPYEVGCCHAKIYGELFVFNTIPRQRLCKHLDLILKLKRKILLFQELPLIILELDENL